MADLPSPPLRGFVLDWRDGEANGRPVVRFWGRLEDGRSFRVRDTRVDPGFWIDATGAEAARRLGLDPRPSGWRSLRRRPLLRIDARNRRQRDEARRRLEGAGVACHEADARPADRYRIERNLRSAVRIRGVGRADRGVDVAFDDPEVTAEPWVPELRLLSLDIETDPRGRRLLSVALHGCGAEEVLLLTPEGFSTVEEEECLPTEADLLRRLEEKVRELDPDVLTGWNVVGFDLRVLAAVAQRVGVRLRLGRDGAPLRVRRARSPRRPWVADVRGRLVLDGVDLVRGAFLRFESMSLEAVSREVLGRGKLLKGSDRAGEILRLFREDRPALVAYNLEDARLVTQILEELHLVELAVERSLLTGLPPDRVASSIAAFDLLYRSALHRRRLVGPTPRADEPAAEAGSGGLVLRPRVGLHGWVAAFDVRSLYPSIIRTFQIDPAGLLEEGEDAEDAVVAPNGARFRREPGVLPGLLDELVPRRAEALERGDGTASHAIKILMNSFYGVLGADGCRFRDARLTNAITGFGRELLTWSRDRVEAWGQRVLYGDTDSLFVALAAEAPEAARAEAEALGRRLQEALAAHIRSTWGVESRLELELERLYRRFFLPPLRHGRGGARKRYAGLVETGAEPEVVLVGLEAVRSDWTELARDAQRELFRRLFLGLPLAEPLRRIVADLRAGRLDDRLVYRKRLRKSPDAYVSTTPPHVAAARKEGRRRGRVAYVVTVAGPEPAAAREHALDYGHYLERQLRPVAAPILEAAGLDLGEVLGEGRQLGLFDDGGF